MYELRLYQSPVTGHCVCGNETSGLNGAKETAGESNKDSQ
jgi:hypothetical protein